jgi:ribonuclease P/MRP protein subunit RPP40
MVLFNRLNFQIKNIISEHQHGFVRRRSTATNLLAVTQSVAHTVDSNSQTDVIYLDFSKAFDKMDHGVILSKLDPIGFTPHLIQFFKSYLEGRRQYVYCNGQYSKNIYMTSGVPQGSVCS